ncbi:MAG TPA: YggS family pyridoxal phosphate-dependent enzyme [Polyangiales bacterium]|nr:YggS family pyridoxal phosphate-dependent enzyme [Polyangiales bacterium]
MSLPDEMGADAIARQLNAVRARIAAACTRAGRAPDAARLIAVSKGHPETALAAAYGSGQRSFGESYVQELVRKSAELGALPEIELRFIGRLQRNKVKDLLRVPQLHAVDCVDSLALAQTLAERAQAAGRTLEVLLQVNVDREPQKAGVLPDALPALVDAVRGLRGLELRGLMVIPRAVDDPEQARPAFAALRALAHQHGLSELSMGMSDDLEIAVEEGATMVRVGTAVFGPRPAK